MKTRLSKIEKTEKDYFDTIADSYDNNYHYQEPFTKYKIKKKSGEFLRAIKKYTKSSKLNILEVGCGTGEYTKHIAGMFAKSKILASDISGHIIDQAKIKCKGIHNISFIVKSAYATGLPKESFDVVFGFYVLHHLSTIKLIKEARRILKPNGLIFFYEPNILNPVVYLVKSNKYLKTRAGDTPNEWAINPLTVKKYFEGFRILNISTSEFIPVLNSIGLKSLIKIDKLTGYLKYVPVVKHFGGSVRILIQKK